MAVSIDRFRLQTIAKMNITLFVIASLGSPESLSSTAGGCGRSWNCESHEFNRLANSGRHSDVLPPGLRIGDGESGGRTRQLNLRDDRAGLLVPRAKNRCRATLASEQERAGD